MELVYLQELRNMGKIEYVTPESEYVIQDICFVRGWHSIFEGSFKGRGLKGLRSESMVTPG